MGECEATYSRDIFFIVPRTWEIFPPTFKTQTQWHWHISLIFSEYIIYCVPCPRNLAPRIQNAGTMARAHFPNILEVFSSLSPVPGKSFFPHPKRRHFCTDTFPPYSRHIIFIFSRTHEIFCPHPKRRHHGTSISLDYSRNILSTVSRTHEFFPPTSKKQAPWYWHISRIFSRYSLHCSPYPRNPSPTSETQASWHQHISRIF